MSTELESPFATEPESPSAIEPESPLAVEPEWPFAVEPESTGGSWLRAVTTAEAGFGEATDGLHHQDIGSVVGDVVRTVGGVASGAVDALARSLGSMASSTGLSSWSSWRPRTATA